MAHTNIQGLDLMIPSDTAIRIRKVIVNMATRNCKSGCSHWSIQKLGCKLRILGQNSVLPLLTYVMKKSVSDYTFACFIFLNNSFYIGSYINMNYFELITPSVRIQPRIQQWVNGKAYVLECRTKKICLFFSCVVWSSRCNNNFPICMW